MTARYQFFKDGERGFVASLEDGESIRPGTRIPVRAESGGIIYRTVSRVTYRANGTVEGGLVPRSGR